MLLLLHILRRAADPLHHCVRRRAEGIKLKVNCTAEEFKKCRNNGVTWIFVSALLVGILALASYFFTEYWQLSTFVFTYTVFYTVVTIYFLKYAVRSAEIEDITADDRDF